MTPRQIIIATIRLVALAGMLNCIANINQMAGNLINPALKFSGTFVVAFAILQIGAWVLLWIFDVPAAARVLPSALSDTSPAPSSLLQWRSMGVICIGLWSSSRSLPDAIYWATLYKLHVGPGSGLGGWSNFQAEQKANIIATGFEVAIGFALLLGGNGFVALLFKIRTAGQR